MTNSDSNPSSFEGTSELTGNLSLTAPARLDLEQREGVHPILEAQWISIELIQENPDQPRKSFSKTKLLELSESIKERGILQPIRVRRLGLKYQIISGERRYRAATEAGLREIPAIICEQSDEDSLTDALIENIQRDDLNAMDRAEALDKLRVNLGSPPWEEVGKKVGLTKRHIFNLIGLKSLPKSIQEEIRDEILTEKHGRALRLLPFESEQFNNLHSQITENKLTGDEAIALARSLKSKNRITKELATLNKIAKSLLSTMSIMDETRFENGEAHKFVNIYREVQAKFEEVLKKKRLKSY